MGQGELKPQSGTCHNWIGGNLGLTVIDSLDTMLIMGLNDLYEEARDWVRDNLDFKKPISVSVFEITIRCLGGLLSAYDITKDEVLLKKAEQLARRLLPAFESSSGIPFSHIDLASGKTKTTTWTSGACILSEMGSIQLEFAYLSHVSGNPIYAQKVFSVCHSLTLLGFACIQKAVLCQARRQLVPRLCPSYHSPPFGTHDCGCSRR